MTRIGSNSGWDPGKGLNSNKFSSSMTNRTSIPHDPFVGIEQEAVDGWNFHNYSKQATWGLSNEWFGEFAWMPGLDYLRQECGDAQAKWAEGIWGGLNWFGKEAIHPEMLVKSDDLGKLIPLESGELSRALLNFFKSREVIFSDLAITYAAKRVEETAQKMLWVAPFASSFGTRCFISFESRLDKSGIERCHIFTNLLISSRWPVILSAEEVDVTLALSKYFSPAVLTGLMYIAETNFPSSIFSMSRSTAFGDVPPSLIPKPIFSTEDYYPAFTHYPKSDSIGFDLDIYPQVIRVGYEITLEMVEVFENIIPTCVDSLVRAISVVEDGFRNYRNPNKPESFDFSFFSLAVLKDTYIEGKNYDGAPRWIPETFLSTLRYSTMDFLHHGYSQNDETVRREICQWVADEGIGSTAVASAINTLAYSYLIPEGKFELAIWYLEAAINLEVINESTNAMVNLGSCYKELGLNKLAIKWLKKALDREDKFGETEACMLLGEVYISQNSRDEAIEYLQRGSSGGSNDKFSIRCKELLSQL